MWIPDHLILVILALITAGPEQHWFVYHWGCPKGHWALLERPYPNSDMSTSDRYFYLSWEWEALSCVLYLLLYLCSRIIPGGLGGVKVVPALNEVWFKVECKANTSYLLYYLSTSKRVFIGWVKICLQEYKCFYVLGVQFCHNIPVNSMAISFYFPF